jgi:hypothetical protein
MNFKLRPEIDLEKGVEICRSQDLPEFSNWDHNPDIVQGEQI